MDWTRRKPLNIVLKEWADSKSQHLFQLLGNQLILRRPFTYEEPVEALKNTIRNNLIYDEIPHNFFTWWNETSLKFKNKIEIECHSSNSSELISCYRWSWWTLMCLSDEALAYNSYNGDNMTIIFPSGSKLKVFKGMKPMKIIHRFVKEFNGPEELFEQFRIWHSQQINKKTLDGELCLSIHPLDYMTMSDNDNDWQSCMRWTGDGHGDYRGGTITCMNSPYIVVAYLHNPAHSFNFDRFSSWNSKRWRELFIVQDGIINEIKGYPYQDENLTNTCLMWIKELAHKNLNWDYEDYEVNVTGEIKQKENDTPTLLFYKTDNIMYNDMGTLEKHRGRINFQNLLNEEKYDIRDQYKEDKIWTTFINIPYGGQVTCMCCGDPLPDTGATNTVLCEWCDNLPRCACCGSPIYNNENYWVEEYDSPICVDCWENESAYDGIGIDEAHLISNMTDLWVLLGYDEDHDPVWYDYTTYCYEPEYNSSYQEMFSHKPLTMEITKHFKEIRTYVTLDMVRPGHEQDFCDAFCAKRTNNLKELAANVTYSTFPIESEEE